MSTPDASDRNTVAILQEFSIPLILGVVVAVIWANLDMQSHEAVIHWSPFGHGSHYNVHWVVNDLFMAVFFGLAAKEITEAALPGGALNPPRKAVNPILATLGGVFGPVGVFFLYVHFSGATEIAGGWGIPTATDIALAWLVARMCFGKGHPAVSFLLLLAVADDAIGLGIIAVFYPDPNHPTRPLFLVIVLAAMIAAYALRRKGVKSFWPYLLVPGAASWLGLYLAHLHPALALVPIVPFMPSAGHDTGLFAEKNDGLEHHDTLNQFEHSFKAFVDFGLFAFGLANAGVVLSSIGDATWAVLSALVVGKTVGIFAFSWVGTKIGFPLPTGMDLKTLFVAGIIAALGLTVALFVAGVAYPSTLPNAASITGAAKMGALLSAFVAPLALLTARLLKVKAPA
jgi:NhaA family Na+:H+ antiporter